MMGRRDRDQRQLFYEFNLDDVIAKELAGVHRKLGPFYADVGRPSVDP